VCFCVNPAFPFLAASPPTKSISTKSIIAWRTEEVNARTSESLAFYCPKREALSVQLIVPHMWTNYLPSQKSVTVQTQPQDACRKNWLVAVVLMGTDVSLERVGKYPGGGSSEMPSSIRELLGEYAVILNRFGVDSCESEDFLERHKENTEFIELAELSRKLKRALTAPHSDCGHSCHSQP
jgi:hypothetical protein